jgi:hypothetical protein
MFKVWLFFGGFLWSLTFSSCQKNIEKGSLQNTFDLIGLVDDQVNYLSRHQYGIHKFKKLGNKKEIIDHYPDSTGWAKELSILKTADINKPGLSPYYRLESSKDSLYEIDTYYLKDTGSVNTLYQKIIRRKQNHLPVKIEARQQTDNPIYHSGRYIEIFFKALSEQEVIIDSIYISGYQKMIFRDTTFYSSISKITK